MIYAYKELSDVGNYVDADEVRWTVHFAGVLHENVLYEINANNPTWQLTFQYH